MGKRIYAIRGAVCAENTPESVRRNVESMCSGIFSLNSIRAEDLVSIQFSMTKDLDCMNPCAALRKSDSGLDTSRVALFCVQESEVKGMLPRTIRVMVTAYLEEGSEPRHVYLNGAEALRPDFAGK